MNNYFYLFYFMVMINFLRQNYIKYHFLLREIPIILLYYYKDTMPECYGNENFNGFYIINLSA